MLLWSMLCGKFVPGWEFRVKGGIQQFCKQELYIFDGLNSYSFMLMFLPVSTALLLSDGGLTWWAKAVLQCSTCVCLQRLHLCGLLKQLCKNSVASFIVLIGNTYLPYTSPYFKIPYNVRDYNLFVFQVTWFNLDKFKSWTYFVAEYVILRYPICWGIFKYALMIQRRIYICIYIFLTVLMLLW